MCFREKKKIFSWASRTRVYLGSLGFYFFILQREFLSALPEAVFYQIGSVLKERKS